jgi:hypothetical protein
LIAFSDVSPSHSHYLSKHAGREWNDKIVFDQSKEPTHLFGFIVGIGDRGFDEFVKVFTLNLAAFFGFTSFIARTSARVPPQRGAEPGHHAFHAGP